METHFDAVKMLIKQRCVSSALGAKLCMCHNVSLCRLQAPLGGLFAMVIPRARIVPAVKPEDMSPDPKVVRTGPCRALSFEC